MTERKIDLSECSLSPSQDFFHTTFMGYTADQIKEMAAFWEKWRDVVDAAPKEFEELAARKEVDDAERAMSEAGKRVRKAREHLASLDGIMLCGSDEIVANPGAVNWVKEA